MGIYEATFLDNSSGTASAEATLNSPPLIVPWRREDNRCCAGDSHRLPLARLRWENAWEKWTKADANADPLLLLLLSAIDIAVSVVIKNSATLMVRVGASGGCLFSNDKSAVLLLLRSLVVGHCVSLVCVGCASAVVRSIKRR